MIMKRKLLININAFCLLLDHTVQQYYQPSVSQFQYNPYQNLQDIQPQYSNQNGNNKWNIQEHKYEYDDEDSKECSCDDCVNLKPLCQNVCLNCFPQQPVIPPMISSYFYFHYPYPYFIMPKETTSTTTTEKLNTTSQTTTTYFIIPETTSPKDTESQANNTAEEEEAFPLPMYIRMKNKRPNKLNESYVLRTKHNRKPKYRKASISDQFAEKLIPQMRNVKELHPRSNNLRNVDDITPYHF